MTGFQRELAGSQATDVKTTVFLNVTPCRWQKLAEVSEMLTPSIIRPLNDELSGIIITGNRIITC
jgi:hypothetical protein